MRNRKSSSERSDKLVAKGLVTAVVLTYLFAKGCNSVDESESNTFKFDARVVAVNDESIQVGTIANLVTVGEADGEISDPDWMHTSRRLCKKLGHKKYEEQLDQRFDSRLFDELEVGDLVHIEGGMLNTVDGDCSRKSGATDLDPIPVITLMTRTP